MQAVCCGYRAKDIDTKIDGDKIKSKCAFCNLAKTKKNIVIDEAYKSDYVSHCRSCGSRTNDVNGIPST